MSETKDGKGKAARSRNDELRFDRRLIGRRDGVSPQELKRHLASLPDLANQAETVPMPGNEEAAPEAPPEAAPEAPPEAAPGEDAALPAPAGEQAEGAEPAVPGSDPGVLRP